MTSRTLGSPAQTCSSMSPTTASATVCPGSTTSAWSSMPMRMPRRRVTRPRVGLDAPREQLEQRRLAVAVAADDADAVALVDAEGDLVEDGARGELEVQALGAEEVCHVWLNPTCPPARPSPPAPRPPARSPPPRFRSSSGCRTRAVVPAESRVRHPLAAHGGRQPRARRRRRDPLDRLVRTRRDTPPSLTPSAVICTTTQPTSASRSSRSDVGAISPRARRCRSLWYSSANLVLGERQVDHRERSAHGRRRTAWFGSGSGSPERTYDVETQRATPDATTAPDGRARPLSAMSVTPRHPSWRSIAVPQAFDRRRAPARRPETCHRPSPGSHRPRRGRRRSSIPAELRTMPWPHRPLEGPPPSPACIARVRGRARDTPRPVGRAELEKTETSISGWPVRAGAGSGIRMKHRRRGVAEELRSPASRLPVRGHARSPGRMPHRRTQTQRRGTVAARSGAASRRSPTPRCSRLTHAERPGLQASWAGSGLGWRT